MANGKHRKFYKKKKTSQHHRKCRSNGGTNHPTNIVIVSLAEHRAFHTLFGNKSPHEIAEYLTNVWIDPAYRMVVHKKLEK